MWQMMTFLDPLDALIPKIPFSFFCRFLGPGHLRGPGSVSVGFGGSRQLSLFGGGGSSQRAVSTPPPQLKAHLPLSPHLSHSYAITTQHRSVLTPAIFNHRSSFSPSSVEPRGGAGATGGASPLRNNHFVQQRAERRSVPHDVFFKDWPAPQPSASQALTAGLCLKGRGAIGEVPERLQSGHRGCEAVGGRLLAVGNTVGADVGVWECLWGRVRAWVLGGRGGTPPLPLKRFPASRGPPLTGPADGDTGQGPGPSGPAVQRGAAAAGHATQTRLCVAAEAACLAPRPRAVGGAEHEPTGRSAGPEGAEYRGGPDPPRRGRVPHAR